MEQQDKQTLIARLRAAWPLSEWRPVDVQEIDARAWNVTYKHRVTGQTMQSGLLKSELARAEANMAVTGSPSRLVGYVRIDDRGLSLELFGVDTDDGE